MVVLVKFINAKGLSVIVTVLCINAFSFIGCMQQSGMTQPEANARLIRTAWDRRANSQDIINLLDAGADINYQELGSGPAITWATRNARLDLVRLLIGRGADVNAIEEADERASIHFAAQRNYRAILEELIKAGGNVNAITRNGITPLYEALAAGHRAAAWILMRAGTALTAVQHPARWRDLLNTNYWFANRNTFISSSERTEKYWYCRSDGRPALQCAVACNDGDSAGLLLQMGATGDVSTMQQAIRLCRNAENRRRNNNAAALLENLGLNSQPSRLAKALEFLNAILSSEHLSPQERAHYQIILDLLGRPSLDEAQTRLNAFLLDSTTNPEAHENFQRLSILLFEIPSAIHGSHLGRLPSDVIGVVMQCLKMLNEKKN